MPTSVITFWAKASIRQRQQLLWCAGLLINVERDAQLSWEYLTPLAKMALIRGWEVS